MHARVVVLWMAGDLSDSAEDARACHVCQPHTSRSGSSVSALSFFFSLNWSSWCHVKTFDQFVDARFLRNSQSFSLHIALAKHSHDTIRRPLEPSTPAPQLRAFEMWITNRIWRLVRHYASSCKYTLRVFFKLSALHIATWLFMPQDWPFQASGCPSVCTFNQQGGQAPELRNRISNIFVSDIIHVRIRREICFTCS